MQVGPSRELFELWAPDARNGLIITGYSIEGTLARVSDNWSTFGGGYLRCLMFTVYNIMQWTFFLHPSRSNPVWRILGHQRL